MSQKRKVTKDEILASIDRLQTKVNLEYEAMTVPPATPEQLDEARALTDDVVRTLQETRGDVDASSDPVTTWNGWVEDTIVPQLTQLSARHNEIMEVVTGCCVYATGRFTSTELECDLPNSSWTVGPCPP